MLFSELEKIVGGEISLVRDTEVLRFSTDSRTLSGASGEVFIAVQGKRDGHDYIQAALDKGVKNVLIEKAIPLEGANVCVVEDAVRAFQLIAKKHRERFTMPILAVTGSNGKTIVKEWLFTILSEVFFVIKSPKSYNSQIGVPLSLLEIRENHEFGIFEAGISQTGEMEKLEQMIQPTLGIFTTLGLAHSEGFQSQVEKLHEKLRLFKHSKEVLCRKDAPYYLEINRVIPNKLITWSLDDDADFQVIWNERSIQINDHRYLVDLQHPTDFENATHCVIAAIHLGCSNTVIQRGLDQIKPIPMRLEFKQGINGCYILDDTYNTDLMGLRVSLDYLATNQQNEKKTLILSDILQSGKSDDELYTIVSQLLKEKGIDRLIGVGPQITAAQDKFTAEALFFGSTEALIADLPPFQNEMVVVKGARDFELERVVSLLEERSHGTVLEVNFESLSYNLNQYRNLLKPSTKLMVMVKANAYGAGLLEVANFLQHQRVDRLGVAYVDEAIQLRKNGINLPIMIMNPHVESFHEFEKYQLEAEIFSFGHLARLLQDTKNPPSIHIKIDTGMHRLGFSPDEVDPLIARLKGHPQVRVAGIFTHFSSADASEEDAFTIRQAEIFDEAYEKLVNQLGYQPEKHACNSSAMVRWPQYHYDMVRLGIGLHGFDPTGKMQLRTTSRLKTLISQIQNLEKGETVGYSRMGKLDRNSRIAILSIGYEDGFLRVFGNGTGSVLINGQLCPSIGNICMDMTMVDVTGVDAKEGDEAVIFGDRPTIFDLAGQANTIPYEILTNISSRVKRVFTWE